MKAQLTRISIDFDGYTLFGDVESDGNYIELDFCGHHANVNVDKQDALRVVRALDGQGVEMSLEVARKHGQLMFPRVALGIQLERIITAMCDVLHIDGRDMLLTFEYGGKSFVFGQRCSFWRRSGVWTYYIENPSSTLTAKVQSLSEVSTARLGQIEGIDAQALDITLRADPEAALPKVIPLLVS